MRKLPPVPEPPGQAYCFVCARMLPESAFPVRGGKLSRPCRECRRTAYERNAPIREALEAAYQRSLNPAPSRPYEPPLPCVCPAMDGFQQWLDRTQKRAPKRRR